MTNAGQSTDLEIAVYLGLGSNLGDREANLRQAIERIKALGLEIRKESSVYESEPVGISDQPWFLNQVIEATCLSAPTAEDRPILGDPQTIATVAAEALLSELLKIEHQMGRVRKLANGPRIIDIDLLLFGDMVIAHSKEDEGWPFIDPIDIFVPHPRMHLRRFVLEPLCEIAPHIAHPILRTNCLEMLKALEERPTVRLYGQP